MDQQKANNTGSAKNRQIDALTSTRGFAALLIVIFHFGLERFPMDRMQVFFTKGNLAVSYFFILSGFIMCWTYKNQHISYGEYIKRRIGRIVPLYLFALLAAISFFLWQHYKHGEVLEPGFAKAATLDTIFLQAWFPHYVLMINSPAWSLSVEMLFYLLFPLFLGFYKKSLKAFTVFALAVFVVSQVIHVRFVTQNIIYTNDYHNFIYYHPALHINEFLFGMLACYWFTLLERRHEWQFPLLLLIAMILFVMYLPPVLHNGLMAPLVAFFIIAITIKQPRFLKLRPLVYLGEISYGIYILQFPVYWYLDKFNTNLLHLRQGSSRYFYIYIAVLLVISALCYHFIEQPLRRKINAVAMRKA